MESWRRTLRIRVMVAVVLPSLMWLGGPAWAQVILGGGIRAVFQGQAAAPVQKDAEKKSDNELAENVFLPADRALLQQLTQARELLSQQRYGEAVRHLGAILDGPEDYFFQPDKNVPLHRSLKGEAQRLIGQMPRQGRDLYQLQYGARAQQMLSDAVSLGDRAGLAEISRRFFHTRAGYEATLLLGLDHLDRGRPLAGALALQRLREAPELPPTFEPTLSLAMATGWFRAGAAEKAQEILRELKKQRADAKPVIGGNEAAWFSTDAAAISWLAGVVGQPRAEGPVEEDRWVMFRGNPARNATAHGGPPLLNMRWRVPVTDDPLTEELLADCRRHDLEQGVPSLPGLHPLAVGDVVLMRSVQNLLAVDFSTGKRLWEIPVDDPWERGPGSNNTVMDAFGQRVGQAALSLGYRMWDDAVFGTFSSDGRGVFTIEDLDIGINPNQMAMRRVIINGRSQMAPVQPTNRLAAHDIRTGKLKWHIGGATDQYPLRQAGTFFLGAPLPLMGQLYVLAEIKEEIRLLALDAQTGDELWSQQLAVVERNIQSDPLRRLAGASPSYADGVLICPTSNGAVVAVDLATRSLSWGYRYERPRLSNPLMGVVVQPGSPGNQQVQRWDDGTAAVVGGCVLISPVESDALHCLSLVDGRLLWKYKRQDDLYVACVHQGSVILVGGRQVRALSLTETANGTETVETVTRSGGSPQVSKTERPVKVPKPAWEGRLVALPEGSMPSGRGFLAGDQYFVPLSSAEVLGIDLLAGKVSRVCKSRKGMVPGNLICYRGNIVSQGFEGVEVFYQLDAVRSEVTRRLAAKADDAEALSLQGEILLDEGKQAEAIACFRRAYELDADARTRDLLRDALLDGLRQDFAAHRGQAAEIERLLDDGNQRATYLRLMAAGLRAAGEWNAALEHYLKLSELDEQYRGLETITKSLAVRRDRWVQAQLASLRQEAKGQEESIDRVIEQRLRAALSADGIDPLRRFLDYFGNHPAAGKARRELFRRLSSAGRLLEAELVLWPEQQSADRAVAGSAVAELAELLRQANRAQDAAVSYDRLRNEFADVVCRDGKTGRQLFEGLPADAPLRQLLGQSTEWPSGNVEAAKPTSSRRSQQIYYANYAVPLPAGARPFFSEMTLRFDQSRMQIHGCDSLGNDRWQVGLIEPGAQQNFPFNPMMISGRVCGHFLLVSMGYRIAAVDALGSSESGKPKLLWGQNILNPNLDSAKLRRLPNQMLMAPWGWQHWQMMQYYNNNSLSAVGPVGSQSLCYQRYRSLVAADPLSGEFLWIRHEIPPGSVLFGDEELVLLVPPEQTEAMVFRALDGELLGTRKVPRSEPAGPALTVAPVGANFGPLGIRPAETTPRSTYNQACVAILGRHVLVWQQDGGERVLELFDPWGQRSLWRSRKFSADARTAVVGQDVLGVFERDGRFALLALTDGRTIAEVKLEAEENLAEISLLRSGDQYVLVTNSPPRSPGVTRRFTQPLPGASDRAINSGRVYALDLQGKLLWGQATKIQQQHLMLNQPSRLPILTFACQLWDQTKQGVSRQRVSVVCLDKRTGRKIYQGDFPSVASTFEIVGDPQKKTIDLRMYQQTVTLTFSDKPIQPIAEEEPPPEEEEEAAEAPAAPKAQGLRGLWKALEKAIINPPKKPIAKPQAAKPAEKPAVEPAAKAKDG